MYNLKIYYRFVLSNKRYFVMNVGALAICLASFMFIVSHILSEKGFDSFHQKKDQIYRVINIRHYPTKIDKSAGCQEKTGIEMKAYFPEVEEYAHYRRKSSIVNVNNQEYREPDVYYATPSFLQIFSFPLIAAIDTKVLDAPYTCLITEATAHKYFGNEDPLGKIIDFQNEDPLVVEGVIKDLPANSYFDFNILVSYSTIQSIGYCESCNNKNTFILVAKNADINKLNGKMSGFVNSIHPDDEFHREYLLQPLKKIHLTAGYRFEVGKTGNGKILSYLSVVALLIILIAWSNYISLNSISSLKRLKEKGIKSISGAKPIEIFFQLLLESLLTSLIALLFGLILFYSLHLLLCDLFQIAHFYVSPIIFVFIGAIILFGSFTNSLIPFLIYRRVSSINVYNLLKFNKTKIGFSRTFFVVTQYIIAILLISFSLLTYKQFKHMVDTELGFNANKVLVVNNYLSKGGKNNQSLAFMENLSKYPLIQEVGFSSSLIGSENGDVGGGFRIEGQNLEQSIQVYEENISLNYLDMLNIEIIEGRNIVSDTSEMIYRNNLSSDILINEMAVKQFGYSKNEDVLGKVIIRENRELGIVRGVVKDFHQRSLESPIVPSFYRCQLRPNHILIKLTLGESSAIVNQINKEYKKFKPSGIFEYYFLNDHFEKQYLNYSKFLRLIVFFTVLAVFICIIGLFSLVRYTIHIRIKEIGVRKVNGAKTIEILTMLNKGIVGWIIIAFILATPIAYYVMGKWLESFAYKTSLNWGIFALSGLITLFIALITVSWQSWRAATRNPVEALRYE